MHPQRTALRTLYVYGTFDSSTTKLQYSPDMADPPVNWFDVSGADAVTASTIKNVEGRAIWARVIVSGGGGSEEITVRLI